MHVEEFLARLGRVGRSGDVGGWPDAQATMTEILRPAPEDRNGWSWPGILWRCPVEDIHCFASPGTSPGILFPDLYRKG